MIPAIIDSPKTWKSSYKEFPKYYQNDLPCRNTIDPELHLWETYWKSFTGTLPETITDTLKATHEMSKSFPNMYSSLRLLATIPVNSCECERAVSVLRRVKTYLRNKMGAERLNGLSLMTIHRGIKLDFDEILTKFATMHKRRMQLVDILDDDELHHE